MGLLTGESVTALQTNNKEYRLVAGVLPRITSVAHTFIKKACAYHLWHSHPYPDDNASRACFYALSGRKS
jgi:hypothetical protein